VTLRARWVDATSSLADATSSLGDAESSLGDTKSSRWVCRLASHGAASPSTLHQSCWKLFWHRTAAAGYGLRQAPYKPTHTMLANQLCTPPLPVAEPHNSFPLHTHLFEPSAP
jgi:hypothetical protein